MRSYYAYSDGNSVKSCSRSSSDYPIELNCTGDLVLKFPFTTQCSREDYYFLYLLHGELEVDLPDGAQTATSGTLLIFPPNHSYRYVSRGDEPVHYLWAHFTGSYAARLLEECGLTPLPFFRKTEDCRLLSEQFRRLHSIIENESPRLRQELACATEQLILTAARAVTATQKHPLERSLHRIHSAFREELRIPDLAALENLSHSRYIALFLQHMGVSPTAYLIGLRMEHACHLLLNTDMSVKQIGASVGYEDPQFFSKLFKKHVGTSPLQYRKNN